MRLIFFTVVAALTLSGGRLNSQQPVLIEKSPEQTLVELKAANEALLERQRVSLEKLDALLKEADQLRIFVKRG